MADVIPHHLAIIMDGNRRWAYARNQSSKFGHDHGSRIVDHLSRHIAKRGVKYLTLFAFSTENWQRSQIELKGIMAVLRHYLKNEVPILIENNVKITLLGSLEGFDVDIAEMVRDAEQQTRGNTGLCLNIALGYGGQADLLQATKALAQEVRAGRIDPESIDIDMLKSNLLTADLPPVDLLIRTGCEKRISNFLLWDLAYAEMAFSEVLWPDFNTSDIDEIFADYACRKRRFGGDTSQSFLRSVG